MKTLNNNVQENYCSFEIIKLLKEKGFDIKTTVYKNIEKNYVDSGGNLTDDTYNKVELVTEPIRPTHALAVEWIKTKVIFGMTIMLEKHQWIMCMNH